MQIASARDRTEDSLQQADADSSIIETESAPDGRGPGLRMRQKLERQRDILQAAIAVVAEKGYHGTRISDIAERAGVAYGLVYHYFGSKERILNSIFENLWERFGERIQRIAKRDQSGVEKLAEISDYMLDTLIARPDIIRLLVQEVVHARNFKELPDLEIVQRINAMIEGVFRESIRRGELSSDSDPRLLSFAFFGSVEMVLTALSTGVYARGRSSGGEVDSRQLKKIKKQMRAFIYGGSFGTTS